MDKLSNPPATVTQWPVHYLIACYGRAAGGELCVLQGLWAPVGKESRRGASPWHLWVCADELRSVSLLKDPADQARLSEALSLARQLAVSYAGLTLLLEMFPQVRWPGHSPPWCLVSKPLFVCLLHQTAAAPVQAGLGTCRPLPTVACPV